MSPVHRVEREQAEQQVPKVQPVPPEQQDKRAVRALPDQRETLGLLEAPDPLGRPVLWEEQVRPGPRDLPVFLDLKDSLEQLESAEQVPPVLLEHLALQDQPEAQDQLGQLECPVRVEEPDLQDLQEQRVKLVQQVLVPLEPQVAQVSPELLVLGDPEVR